MREKKILQLAKGFWGRSKNCPTLAQNRVEKALQYAYRDRRNKKREFRSSWIMSINAAAREHDLKYGELVHGLQLANIELNRKVLANLAQNEPLSFQEVINQARSALAKKYDVHLQLQQAQAQTAAAAGKN